MFGRKKAFELGRLQGRQEMHDALFAGRSTIYVDRNYCTHEIYERIRQVVIECCKELPPGTYRYDDPPINPGNFGGIRP